MRTHGFESECKWKSYIRLSGQAMRRDGRGHERINRRRLRGHAWYHAWGTMRGTMAGVQCYVGFHAGVRNVLGYKMCWDGPHRSWTINNPRLDVLGPALQGPDMMPMRSDS